MDAVTGSPLQVISATQAPLAVQHGPSILGSFPETLLMDKEGVFEDTFIIENTLALSYSQNKPTTNRWAESGLSGGDTPPQLGLGCSRLAGGSPRPFWGGWKVGKKR